MRARSIFWFAGRCPAGESEMAPGEECAMKRTVFLFAWLLAVPALAAAQSQTRDRRSSESETPRTGSTAIRDRIVGPTRVANHVEKQKTKQEAPPVATSNP